ncbi:MAG: pyridoxal-phosphate dependent enzyme, partial [Myxococcota bacterium]
LKEVRPDVRIVGCQPTEGSRIPGIRRWPKAYLPKIFEADRVDETRDVAQADAEAKARELAATTGVFVGASAAGAVLTAQRVAQEIDEGTLVTILCDRGDRYLSSPLFDEAGALEVIE